MPLTSADYTLLRRLSSVTQIQAENLWSLCSNFQCPIDGRLENKGVIGQAMTLKRKPPTEVGLDVMTLQRQQCYCPCGISVLNKSLLLFNTIKLMLNKSFYFCLTLFNCE